VDVDAREAQSLKARDRQHPRPGSLAYEVAQVFHVELRACHAEMATHEEVLDVLEVSLDHVPFHFPSMKKSRALFASLSAAELSP